MSTILYSRYTCIRNVETTASRLHEISCFHLRSLICFCWEFEIQIDFDVHRHYRAAVIMLSFLMEFDGWCDMDVCNWLKIFFNSVWASKKCVRRNNNNLIDLLTFWKL